MKSPVLGLRVASTLIALVGLAHLVRLLAQTRVLVADWNVPLWVSGVAVIASAVLCVWLWMVSLPEKEPEDEHVHHAATPAES